MKGKLFAGRKGQNAPPNTPSTPNPPLGFSLYIFTHRFPLKSTGNPLLNLRRMAYHSSLPFSLHKFGSFFFLLSLLLLHSPTGTNARTASLPPRPAPSDAAATARWLAAQNIWGVLSTISSDLGGAPFGNVVSFSDGLPGHGRGIPYFYLTELDPTARNALKDGRSSFTVSEYALGACGSIDPENPTCAKLTLTGKLKLVNSQSAEAKFALNALFSKHPEMKVWPKDHSFQIFKLDIESIFLIDWFGGAKPLTPAQYLKNGK